MPGRGSSVSPAWDVAGHSDGEKSGSKNTHEMGLPTLCHGWSLRHTGGMNKLRMRLGTLIVVIGGMILVLGGPAGAHGREPVSLRQLEALSGRRVADTDVPAVSGAAPAIVRDWKLAVRGRVDCRGGLVVGVRPALDGRSPLAVYNRDAGSWGEGRSYHSDEIGFWVQDAEITIDDSGSVFLSAPESPDRMRVGSFYGDEETSGQWSFVGTAQRYCRRHPNDDTGSWVGPFLIYDDKDLNVHARLSARDCRFNGTVPVLDPSYALSLSYDSVFERAGARLPLTLGTYAFSTKSRRACLRQKVPWSSGSAEQEEESP